MQNSPAQVHVCTQASRFIVEGMCAIASLISAAPLSTPARARVWWRNASRSSGGYSRVVATVHSTAPRKAAAPM